MPKKITDLQPADLNSDTIDNCLYIQDLNKPEMRYVPMKKVFEWIKETAIKEGLTVMLEGEQIMFIKGEIKKDPQKRNYLKICDRVEMKDGRILTVKSLEFDSFVAVEDRRYIPKKDILKIF